MREAVHVTWRLSASPKHIATGHLASHVDDAISTLLAGKNLPLDTESTGLRPPSGTRPCIPIAFKRSQFNESRSGAPTASLGQYGSPIFERQMGCGSRARRILAFECRSGRLPETFLESGSDVPFVYPLSILIDRYSSLRTSNLADDGSKEWVPPISPDSARPISARFPQSRTVSVLLSLLTAGVASRRQQQELDGFCIAKWRWYVGGLVPIGPAISSTIPSQSTRHQERITRHGRSEPTC